MVQKRPLIIYPEYFDFNLKLSQGRKVPLNQCVKKPNINEIFLISKKLNLGVKKSNKSHSGNWASNSGSLLVDYSGPKTSLLHKIGLDLKNLRKTD